MTVLFNWILSITNMGIPATFNLLNNHKKQNKSIKMLKNHDIRQNIENGGHFEIQNLTSRCSWGKQRNQTFLNFAQHQNQIRQENLTRIQGLNYYNSDTDYSKKTVLI